MIRLHNMDPSQSPHPNATAAIPILIPASSPALYLAATAESALPAAGSATPITLTAAALAIIPGVPSAIAFTVAGGAVATTLRVFGVDSEYRSVVEDVVLTAADTYYTLYAYRRLTQVLVIARTGVANTISIGMSLAVGTTGTEGRYYKFGLPFRPYDGTTGAGKEIAAWLSAAGAASANVTLDAFRNTLRATTAPVAGLQWLLVDVKQKGFRN